MPASIRARLSTVSAKPLQRPKSPLPLKMKFSVCWPTTVYWPPVRNPSSSGTRTAPLTIPRSDSKLLTRTKPTLWNWFSKKTLDSTLAWWPTAAAKSAEPSAICCVSPKLLQSPWTWRTLRSAEVDPACWNTNSRDSLNPKW